MIMVVIIVFLVALAAFSVRRLGVVSPATFLLMFSAATCLQMVIAARNQSFLWYTQMDLDSSAYAAAFYFVGLSLLSLFSSLVAMPVKTAVRHDFKFFIREKVQRKISGYLSLIVPAIFLLSFWHFLNADFTNSWYYLDYMSSRELSFYGIDDPISAVSHKLLKLFGVIAATLLPMIAMRRPFLLLMCFCIVLYVLVFHLILGSKYVGLLLGLCAMSFLLVSKSRYRKIFALFLLGLGVWLVLASFSMRATRQYGLETFLEHGVFLDDLDRFALLRASHLIFGGANLLQFGLAKPLEFDSMYALLSFSPLISAFDGYSNYKVVDSSTTLMFWENKSGTIWAPVSGLGEAAAFGWPYVVFLFGVITLTARECQKLINSVGGEIAAIPTSLFILGVVIITMYPIRNGFRFILLALIIAWLLSRWVAAKRRRRSSLSLP